MRKMFLSTMFIVWVLLGEEIVKFEPSNYYVDTNGDTVLILPESQDIQSIEGQNGSNTPVLFGGDLNLTEKSGCGHPGLATATIGSNYYVYVTTETSLNDQCEVYIREWQLVRSGYALNAIFTNSCGWYSSSGTLYFPAIATTSSNLMLLFHKVPSYYTRSVIYDLPGLENSAIYYLDADVNVVEPDVAPASASGDNFYAVATYKYSDTDSDIRFYTTTNGGQTWNKTTLRNDWVNEYWLARIASDPSNYSRVGVVWIKNNNEAIECRLSSNGGSSWSGVHTWNNLAWPDIAIYGSTVFIVAKNGSNLQIIYSTDFGSSWNGYTIDPPDVVEYPAIEVSQGGMWMIVYSDNDGDVYYTYSYDTNVSGSDFNQVSDGSYGVPDRPAVVEDPTMSDWAIVAWKDSRSSTDIYGDCEYGSLSGEEEKISFKDSKELILPSSIISNWPSFLKDKENLTIYRLDGTKISKESTPKPGVYFLVLKDKGRTLKQKIVFMK